MGCLPRSLSNRREGRLLLDSERFKCQNQKRQIACKLRKQYEADLATQLEHWARE